MTQAYTQMAESSMASQTPRADAAIKDYLDHLDWGTYPDVLIKLVRELEIELMAKKQKPKMPKRMPGKKGC